VQTRKRQGFRPDLGADLGRKFAAFAATYTVKTAPELLRQILTDFMEKELDADADRKRRYLHRLRVGKRQRRDRLD
jgi:hypothetical protein